MKIGILGGSFDPPHNGHLHVVKTLLQQKICQKIILMPCFKHPFGKPLSSSTHRLAMTKLLKQKNIEASDLEIKNGKISYTIDTLKTLKSQSPKGDFVWIVGEDQLESFTGWKNWREIIERFGLIVMPRNKRPPRVSPTATPEVKEWILAPSRWPNGLLEGAVFLDKKIFKPLNISSSEIRKRIKEGLSINNLVPNKVEKYIIKHGLYVN